MSAPPMNQKPSSSARSQLISMPLAANRSAVTAAWNRAAPGSERPMTWCQPRAAKTQISIASSAAIVRWSTCRTSWMAKV